MMGVTKANKNKLFIMNYLQVGKNRQAMAIRQNFHRNSAPFTC